MLVIIWILAQKTGMRLSESFAQNVPGAGIGDTGVALYERPERIERTDAELALRGGRMVLRPGVVLATTQLSARARARHRIELDSAAVHLIAVNEGELRLSLPDLGATTIRSGSWCLLAADQLTVHLSAGQAGHFSVIRCAASVFNSLVEMAELPRHSRMHCLSCPQSMKPLFLHGEASERLAKLGRVMGIGDHTGLAERIFIEAHCLKWMGELILQPEFNGSSQPEGASACSEQDASCLREVAEYLKAQLEAEHSLHELSRRFHLNECKLKSGFKQVYNQTVFSYLRECRMQRAEALLRETDGSVLDIACEVGYSNASHFSRSFKERFGMLPKAYQCLHSAVRRAHA